jgi:hypothetical protein
MKQEQWDIEDLYRLSQPDEVVGEEAKGGERIKNK